MSTDVPAFVMLALSFGAAAAEQSANPTRSQVATEVGADRRVTFRLAGARRS